MGKTDPMHRGVFDAIKHDWQPFRRGLRYRDQQAFDSLFVGAASYRDAAGLQNHPDAMTLLLVSALLHHQRRIEELEECLEASNR